MIIMKRTFTLFLSIILFSIVFAQAPQKMSYQAVIRDASNKLVVNKQVGMKISILQGTATGSNVYTETQKPTTNANGLVSIEIGGGTNFSTIDWSNGPYFIETNTDPSGGNNYTITGTSQFLSVPYALHSQTAQQLIGSIKENQISDLKRFTNNDETDPIFHSSVAQGITASDTASWNKKSDFNGNYDALTNKPVIPLKLSELNNDTGFITNPNDDDASPTNEIQILSINNDTIYLTQGGFVKLPTSFSGNYSDLNDKPTNLGQFTNDVGYQLKSEDGDTNPENEMQRLYFTTSNRIGLTGGGYVDMIDVEADPKFNASPAKGITGTNIGNWNTAYGWGNHATAGYLTSYSESDPRFAADSSFIKSGIRDWNSSLAKSIDATDTTWWGREETDPVYTNDSLFLKTGIRDWNSSLAKSIDTADTTWWGREETDPVYTNDSLFLKTGIRDWNSSLAKSIDATDTTWWGREETDPVYTNDSLFLKTGIRDWNSSLAKSIDATDTTWWGREETDPVYTNDSLFLKTGIRDWNSSLAKSIDTADTTWWGREETDPVYTNDSLFLKTGIRDWNSSIAKNITNNDTTNWNNKTYISDSDGDTKIETEQTSDDDVIHMKVANTEAISISNYTGTVLKLPTSDDNSSLKVKNSSGNLVFGVDGYGLINGDGSGLSNVRPVIAYEQGNQSVYFHEGLIPGLNLYEEKQAIHRVFVLNRLMVDGHHKHGMLQQMKPISL
jgi:hypothetical protein